MTDMFNTIRTPPMLFSLSGSNRISSLFKFWLFFSRRLCIMCTCTLRDYLYIFDSLFILVSASCIDVLEVVDKVQVVVTSNAP